MPVKKPRLGDLVAVPVDVNRPFTRQAGLASGLTDKQLQSAEYRRLFQGVYVHRSVEPSAALWAEGAGLITPAGSFAAYQSAARILGGIVPSSPDTHLGTVSRATCDICQLRLHRYAAPPPLTTVDGLLVTTPGRTLADLARSLTLLDLVVFGDSLVHAGATTPERLREEVAAVRGPRLARRAAAYVRAGAESPTESRLRMLYVLAGLPEPQTQVTVERAGGGSYRIDLGWPQVKVGAEYDGAYHRDDPGQAEHDAYRRGELSGLGWSLSVVTSTGLYAAPADVLVETWELLQERGLHVGRIKSGWQAHFPGRRAA